MQHIFFENEEILLVYDTGTEKWYIKNILSGGNFDLSMTGNLSSFLQILYESPDVFFTRISKKAKETNIDKKIIDRLPFKESIIFCIKNGMLFWLELSLKWIDFLKIDEDLKQAIKTVISDSKYPQRIRHRLKKIVK